MIQGKSAVCSFMYQIWDMPCRFPAGKFDIADARPEVMLENLAAPTEAYAVVAEKAKRFKGYEVRLVDLLLTALLPAV